MEFGLTSDEEAAGWASPTPFEGNYPASASWLKVFSDAGEGSGAA